MRITRIAIAAGAALAALGTLTALSGAATAGAGPPAAGRPTRPPGAAGGDGPHRGAAAGVPAGPARETAVPDVLRTADRGEQGDRGKSGWPAGAAGIHQAEGMGRQGHRVGVQAAPYQ